MRRATTYGLFTGLMGAAFGAWWWRRRVSTSRPAPAFAGRGTVIFRNTPTGFSDAR